MSACRPRPPPEPARNRHARRAVQAASMKARLKPLSQQTIVITGASSGIGLTTARKAAEKGARLLLAARNEEALRVARDRLNHLGARVEYAVADVGDREQVREVVGRAQSAFGGFDTWI